MRLKVIALATLTIFLSGCSWTSTPQPKEPKKPNIKVVEEVQQPEQDTTVTTVEPTEIKETTKNKYNLKPEPFSLKSNEDDPELLGPQTTIDRGLKKEENSDTETEAKSDKVVKKEDKEDSTNENKKETL